MIVKNQNDILTILKMYMTNTNVKQSQICNRLGLHRSAVSRTLSNTNNSNITLDTLLSYIDACNAVLDINIIPNPNKGKDTDTKKDNK